METELVHMEAGDMIKFVWKNPPNKSTPEPLQAFYFVRGFYSYERVVGQFGFDMKTIEEFALVSRVPNVKPIYSLSLHSHGSYIRHTGNRLFSLSISSSSHVLGASWEDLPDLNKGLAGFWCKTHTSSIYGFSSKTAYSNTEQTEQAEQSVQR